jgi:hypothetical protein
MFRKFLKFIKPRKETFTTEKDYIVKSLEYIKNITDLTNRNAKLEKENKTLRGMMTDGIRQKFETASKLGGTIKQQNLEIKNLKAILKFNENMKRYM